MRAGTIRYPAAMSSDLPYDGFAGVYDAWVRSIGPLADEMRDFYVDLLLAADGPVAELGVGNGRICVEVAKRGKAISGVDSAAAMLELCRERARQAGVENRLTLIQADFRDFELPAPAELIVLPFHSLGHLLTDGNKLRALERIHGQLAPGGRLVWDHFVFDPDYPVPPGIPNLRARFPHPETGHDRLVWETTTRDHERRVLDVLVRIEDLDADGLVRRSRYVPMQMSWISPERSRELMEEAGFEIEVLWGDFRRTPYEEGAGHQVWVGRTG